MNLIEIENIQVTYPNGVKVLDGLSVSIPKGKIVTLIGESGSGKTTLLKTINGMVPVSGGNIRVFDKDIAQWNLIELRRRIGYVIQQIGLFPHLTIEENIQYVPVLMGTRRPEKARELIALVGMSEVYLKRYPRSLSGGQKQRIGVARALAADPELLLMDEPFGAVDEITRSRLQEELLDIQRKLSKTIVFVTHDIHEALKMGDVVILFKEGRIVEMGSPSEMIFNHNSAYAQEFFGYKHYNTYLNETRVRTLPVIKAPYSDVLPAVHVDDRLVELVTIAMRDTVNGFNVFNEYGYIGQFYIGGCKDIKK